MPPSMRAQAPAHKRQIAKRKEEGDRRAKVLSLVEGGDSALKASGKTGVSGSTATRIKKAYQSSNTQELKTLLNTEDNYAGRKPVLSPHEEPLVVSRALHAARHGFAVENDVMSTVHAKMSADRCARYANGLPSSDAIRSFRARNRSLAYRVAENVSSARLAAENQSHIMTLENALKRVEENHPGMFGPPPYLELGRDGCLGRVW